MRKKSDKYGGSVYPTQFGEKAVKNRILNADQIEERLDGLGFDDCLVVYDTSPDDPGLHRAAWKKAVSLAETPQNFVKLSFRAPAKEVQRYLDALSGMELSEVEWVNLTKRVSPGPVGKVILSKLPREVWESYRARLPQEHWLSVNALLNMDLEKEGVPVTGLPEATEEASKDGGVLTEEELKEV